MAVVSTVTVLALCFFGDCTPGRGRDVVGTVLAEIIATLCDPGTQWMVFLCAGIYALAFGVIRRRLAGGAEAVEGGGSGLVEGGELRVEGWGLGEPAFWLAGLMVLAAVAYTLDYPQAVKSAQALTLLGAAMIGQGAGFWESRKQKAEKG